MLCSLTFWGAQQALIKKIKRYCFNYRIKIHYVLIFRNFTLNLRGEDLFGCKYKKHKYLENFGDRLNKICP